MKKVLVSVLAVMALAVLFAGVSTTNNAASDGVTANSLVDPVF